MNGIIPACSFCIHNDGRLIKVIICSNYMYCIYGHTYIYIYSFCMRHDGPTTHNTTKLSYFVMIHLWHVSLTTATLWWFTCGMCPSLPLHCCKHIYCGTHSISNPQHVLTVVVKYLCWESFVYIWFMWIEMRVIKDC